VQDSTESNKDENVTEKSNKKKVNLGSKYLPWIIIVVILIAGIGGVFYYKNRAEKVESDPTSVQKEKNQEETERVLTALKQILTITETDAPTVARVEDPAKLQNSNPEFYKNVQTGDYLVIFPKRAIIFRESSNQIINIAPIINTSDLEAKQAEQSQQPASGNNR
jgi:flagellar basal body-associated protein FliL